MVWKVLYMIEDKKVPIELILSYLYKFNASLICLDKNMLQLMNVSNYNRWLSI